MWPDPVEGSARAWCRQCGVSGDALAWATRFAGRDPHVPGSTVATLREHGLLRPALAEHPLIDRSNPACAATLPDCGREQYEERAAIHEYDGGLSRAEAEVAAHASTIALVKEFARRELDTSPTGCHP